MNVWAEATLGVAPVAVMYAKTEPVLGAINLITPLWLQYGIHLSDCRRREMTGLRTLYRGNQREPHVQHLHRTMDIKRGEETERAWLTGARASVETSRAGRSEAPSQTLAVRLTNSACGDVDDGGKERKDEHRERCNADDWEHFEMRPGRTDRSGRIGRRRTPADEDEVDCAIYGVAPRVVISISCPGTGGSTPSVPEYRTSCRDAPMHWRTHYAGSRHTEMGSNDG